MTFSAEVIQYMRPFGQPKFVSSQLPVALEAAYKDMERSHAGRPYRRGWPRQPVGV